MLSARLRQGYGGSAVALRAEAERLKGRKVGGWS